MDSRERKPAHETCLRSRDSDAFLRKVAAEVGVSLRLVKELLG